MAEIMNGPQKEDFKFNKFFIHKDFNPKAKIINYARQSKSGPLQSKEWQLKSFDVLSKENTVISTNSAFNEKKAPYIFEFLKYLFEKGNRDFYFHISDYSRFSRNTKITDQIYIHLYENNVNFKIVVGDVIYDFKECYWKGLRDKFMEAEKYSLELSRQMKTIKQRKDYANVKVLATDYFKHFITSSGSIKFDQKVLDEVNRPNFSNFKIASYKLGLARRNVSFPQEKEFFYFYCSITKCMIICPEELAYKENLTYRIIEGFNQVDFITIAKSKNPLLNWICYYP